MFVERDKKVRLTHLAKEWNVEAKVLLDLCHQLGIPASSHLAILDPTEIDRLRDAFGNRVAKAAARNT